MTPCLTFQEIAVDLTKMKLAEAWKRIFEAVSNYPIPSECADCGYLGICPQCVVQHSYGAPLGHANPVICERTRRFVAEGLITPKHHEKRRDGT